MSNNQDDFTDFGEEKRNRKHLLWRHGFGVFVAWLMAAFIVLVGTNPVHSAVSVTIGLLIATAWEYL